MSDRDIGKRMVEQQVLKDLLESYPIITGQTVTKEWTGEAHQFEGSPDFIIGLDGKPFGVELTELRGTIDVWGYVEEAYRLAQQKSESYARRGIFQYPIGLFIHSRHPPLFDIRESLRDANWRDDFAALGFTEIWGVDFSEAYYTRAHPHRRADMFCFKPGRWLGFHRIGGDRKPFG